MNAFLQENKKYHRGKKRNQRLPNDNHSNRDCICFSFPAAALLFQNLCKETTYLRKEQMNPSNILSRAAIPTRGLHIREIAIP